MRSAGPQICGLPSSDTRSLSQEEGEKVTENKVVLNLCVLQHSLGHFKEQVPVYMQEDLEIQKS